MGFTDKELGMDRNITRRDFMNGAAMAIGAAAAARAHHLFAQQATAEAQNTPGYDPPALHGMRGSHAGSFEVAHRLRDGTFWANAGKPESTGETYDLVVVGGGISGLSSARFFHQAAGKQARVLILENHDDFGGHAKRNEFQVDRTFMLGYGGTYSIESPAPYSPVAKRVIRDLGIDVSSYSSAQQRQALPLAGAEAEDLLRPGNLRRRPPRYQPHRLRHGNTPIAQSAKTGRNSPRRRRCRQRPKRM